MGKAGTPRSKTSRTDFLSATKSAAIAETIRKEERTLAKLLETQIALGRIQLPEEEADEAHLAGEAAASPPEVDTEQVARLVGAAGLCGEADDPAAMRQERLKDISRSVWSVVNPGYVERSGAFQSSTKADFAWRAEEVEAMRQQMYPSPQGELDTRHHKKRDNFTVYSEAHLRNIHMGRRGGEPQKAQ